MENKRLIAATKYAVWQRNYRRARERALTRLAQAYPDEYRIYLEQEKENDYTQGKTWIDLDGNTNASVDTNTGAVTDRGRDTPTETRNESRTGNL
jgi:hypothetical protein